MKDYVTEINEFIKSQEPSTAHKLFGTPLFIRVGATKVGDAITKKARAAIKTRLKAITCDFVLSQKQRRLYKPRLSGGSSRSSLSEERRSAAIAAFNGGPKKKKRKKKK